MKKKGKRGRAVNGEQWMKGKRGALINAKADHLRITNPRWASCVLLLA